MLKPCLDRALRINHAIFTCLSPAAAPRRDATRPSIFVQLDAHTVMTTPRPPRVSSGEASIPRGRQAYAEGQYKTAIEHFTLVANACSCNRGGRRERCKCKDFEKVAQDGASIFKEAMHKCSCDASRKYKKCHEPSHIQALDYRAAVFEKMGRLDLAKKDAAWLLEIAPRSLEVA